MKNVIAPDVTGGLPVKSWCGDIEDGAREQALNLARLPFAYKHVALMPDCHTGYGMPIGGVLATKDVVIPNAVGVDIGCGMIAVKTSLTNIDSDAIKTVFSLIREQIPVGFSHHSEPKEWDGFNNAPLTDVVQAEIESAAYQIGTLGGGNHFIEIQKGDDGNIWLMLHSGSRNFGFKIANYYHKKAKELCAKWHSRIPDPDLAFLPVDHQEGQDYLASMKFALAFAFESRKRMMDVFMNAVYETTSALRLDNLNVHHNYASLEHHYGKNVWVHRKGAIRAMGGDRGIVPGSQGTTSYIVSGLGNPESFYSCSHGAGRTMGRKQAQRELSLESEIDKLNAKGIIHSIRTVKDLDEAPSAYKDIDIVMESQKDLVEVITKLTPIGVVKG